MIEKEALQARLDIRDFHFNELVKGIYENIGQVLSYVRLQLGKAAIEGVKIDTAEIIQSGNLVGQSIDDLRNMCRHFLPDSELEKYPGVICSLEPTWLALGQHPAIEKSNSPKINSLHATVKVITFRLLQQIMVAINDTGITITMAKETIAGECLKITLQVSGENKKIKETFQFIKISKSIRERLDLLNALIRFKKVNEKPSIILLLPLNLPL